jgi:hypothetical protein
MAKMKAIDTTAPHAARAASNQRRSGRRHAGPVRERLFDGPVLITPPCFGLLSKALFSACEAGALVMVCGFFPQSVTAYYWLSFYR